MTAVSAGNAGGGPRPGEEPAAGIRDLGALLEARCGSKYGYTRGKFVLDPPAGLTLAPATSLLDAGIFQDVIDRFAAGFPGADRRAVVSLWTMYYFSALTIGAVLAFLELRLSLPLALDAVDVALDPNTGAPGAFVLADFGSTAAGDPHQALAPALAHHAEPLIGSIARHAKVAPKLIWGNAASYLVWAVEETGRLTDPALTREGARLYEDQALADGSRNPLFATFRPIADETGATVKQRKVCCLRYCIAAIGGCGASCPLPEGRGG